MLLKFQFYLFVQISYLIYVHELNGEVIATWKCQFNKNVAIILFFFFYLYPQKRQMAPRRDWIDWRVVPKKCNSVMECTVW